MEEYKEMIAPSDLYVLEHANRFSENNIMHCCGWAGAKNRLSVWQDYPVKCVNWAVFVEEMPLTEGRFFWGGRVVLGGFQSLHQDDGTYKLDVTFTEDETEDWTEGNVAFKVAYGANGVVANEYWYGNAAGDNILVAPGSYTIVFDPATGAITY